MAELVGAAEETPLGKAPRFDRIPAEVVLLAAQTKPHVILDVLNRLLALHELQNMEETTILIPKSATANTLPVFTPIRLLNSMGKLYEKLIKERLEVAINDGGGLSEQ
ncbi:hypothetical protein Trydic_g5484 [Trypoxylus dichotomus]